MPSLPPNNQPEHLKMHLHGKIALIAGALVPVNGQRCA